jgi:hypothetical protein
LTGGRLDQKLRVIFDNLSSTDNAIRLEAFNCIMDLTEQDVSWIYEIWDPLVEKLSSGNSFQRSIGVMILCNLAKSDSENRLEEIIDVLLKHTNDEQFITARQSIQHIWKIGVGNNKIKEKITTHLVQQYRECETEKHYNLIRTDIIQSLKSLADSDLDPSLLSLVEDLIGEEKDPKHMKKYRSILRE